MKDTSDESFEFRARIGVGACLGIALGAVLAQLIVGTIQAKIIGMIVGGLSGALVGWRLRSQTFEYLWIELPRESRRRLLIALFIFLVPFSGFIISLKMVTPPILQIILMIAAVLGGILQIYVFGYVISQLDDLLRNILYEAIAIGFGLSLGFFLTLGIVSLAYPVPTNWLIVFIIMLAFMLLGRILAVVKYR